MNTEVDNKDLNSNDAKPMLSAVVRAELKPLSGKYYGTYVELFDKDDNSLGEVKFWFPTREYGKEYVSPREKEHVIKDCDDEWYLDWDWTHSENLLTYEVAMLFVNAVNNSR